MANPDLGDVATWLDDRASSGEFSGVLLLRRGAETLFAHAAGFASRAHHLPNAVDTRFAVASVTKWPVAVATLRLVERGTLDLQARLVDLLPPEWRPGTVTPDHTLHHLLSQTSGLPNYHDDEATTWDSFTSAIARAPGRGRHPADLLPLLADLPFRRPPGEAYEYADTNFVLVGLVLEAVTGRPWGDILADEVLGPAGMSDTGLEAIDEDPARLATGYIVDDGPVGERRTNVLSVTASPMPDGGMLTTAGDLAAFVDALLDGRLLGPDLLAEMMRPQAPFTGDPEQYGYGCQLVVEGGRPVVIGHSGSDPGVAAMVSHYLEPGITIVAVCNQDRGAWAATLRAGEAVGIRDPRAA